MTDLIIGVGTTGVGKASGEIKGLGADVNGVGKAVAAASSTASGGFDRVAASAKSSFGAVEGASAKSSVAVSAGWQRGLSTTGAGFDRLVANAAKLSASHPDLAIKSNIPAIEAQLKGAVAELRSLGTAPSAASTERLAQLKAQAAAASRELAAITREAKEAAPALDRVADKGEKVGKSFGGLGALATAGVGFLAIKSAGETAIRVASDWSKAAAQDSLANDQLTQSFKNSGIALTAQSSKVTDLIAANQRLGVSDDSTRTNLQTLIDRTHDYGKSVDLLGYALDLSAAKHISLEAATKAVYLADSDSITMLNRMGIAVDSNATAEQNLQAIRAASSGQMAALADSQVGSMNRVSDSVSEMGETFGYQINEAVKPAWKSLANELQAPDTQQAISDVAGAVGASAKMMADGLVGAVDMIKPAVTWMKENPEVAKAAMVGMFTAIGVAATAAAVPVVVSLSPVIAVMAAVGAAAFGLKLAWDENFLGMQEGPKNAAAVALASFELFKGGMLGVAKFIEPWLDTVGGAWQRFGALVKGETIKAGDEFKSNLTAKLEISAREVEKKLLDLNVMAIGLMTTGGSDAGKAFGDGILQHTQYGYTAGAQVGAEVAKGTQEAIKASETAATANEWIGTFKSSLLSSLESANPAVFSKVLSLLNSSDLKGAMSVAATALGNDTVVSLANTSINKISELSPDVQMALSGPFSAFQETAKVLGSNAGISFTGKLVDSVGTQLPAVSGVLHWLAQNSDKYGQVLWAALGTNAASQYAANLKAGVIQANLAMAAELRAQGKEFVGAGGWRTEAGKSLINQANQVEQKAVGDFGNMIPELQKVGALPEPPKKPDGPKGPDSGPGKGAAGSAAKEQVKSAVEVTADVARSVSEAVKNGVDAIKAIGDLQVPNNLAAQTDAFAAATEMIVGKLETVIKKYDEKSLAALALYGESTGKLFSGLSTASTMLTSLKDFSKPTDAAMISFRDALDYQTDLFRSVIAKWDKGSLEAAGQYGDGTGKLIAGISGGVAMLTSLKDFVKPSDDVMIAFRDGLDYQTDLLRPVMVKWSKDQLEFAGQYGDGVGKLLSGVSSGTALLSSLVKYEDPARSSIDAFVSSIDYMSDTLRPAMSKWTKDSLEFAGQYGDGVGKLLSGVSSGVDLLGSLVKFVRPSNANMEAFADGLDYQAALLRPVVAKWSKENLEAVSLYGDGTGKLISGVSGSVAMLSSLVDFKKPTDAAMIAWRDALDFQTDLLRSVFVKWDKDTLELAGLYGDGTGKLISGVAGGVEMLSSLNDFKKPSDKAMISFRDALDFQVDILRPAIVKWNADTLKLAGEYGEGVGKLTDGVLKGAALLSGLVDFKKPSDAAMIAFRDGLDYQLDIMRGAVSKWSPEALEQIGVYGENVGKLLDGASKATGLFKELSDPKFTTAPKAAVEAYFDAQDDFVLEFAVRSTSWTIEGLDLVAKQAIATGQIVDGAGKAIGLLNGLAEFKGVPVENVRSYFDALDLTVKEFAARSDVWKVSATEEATKLAANVGSVTDGIGKSIDPLVKLADPKTVMPSKEAIQKFFYALDFTLTLFAQESEGFKAKASDEVAKLGVNVGTVMDGVGKALDPITKMKDVQAITPEQIEGSLANIYLALFHFNRVMEGGELQGDWKERATEFSGALNIIGGALNSFTSIKFDPKSLEGLKDLGPVITEVMAGVNPALDTAMSDREEGSLGNIWKTRLGWMFNYVRDPWRGMVLQEFKTGGTDWGNSIDQTLADIGTSWSGGLDGIATTTGPKGEAIGSALVAGTKKGIDDHQSEAINAAVAMAAAALAAAKTELGIASPSKEFYKLGAFAGDGFAGGLKASKPQVGSAVSEMVAVPPASSGAIKDFKDSLVYLMNELKIAVDQWGKDGSRSMSKTGTAVLDLVTGLSSSLDFFTKLGDPNLKLPVKEGIKGYFDTLDLVTQEFYARGSGWQRNVSEAKLEVGKRVADLTNSLLGPLDGLKELADPKLALPGKEAIKAYFDTLTDFLIDMGSRKDQWGKLATKEQSDLSALVGSTVEGIGKTFGPLSALADFKAATPGTADRMFDSLTEFLTGLEANAGRFSGKATESQAKMTNLVGDTVAGIGKVFGPLSALAAFVKPSPAAIPNLFASLDIFLDAMVAKSKEWADKATEDRVKIATNIGGVFSGIGQALDVVGKIDSMGSLSQTRVDKAIGGIKMVLTGIDGLAAGTDPGKLDMALNYAGKLGTMAGQVSSALDMLDRFNTVGVPSESRTENVLAAINRIINGLSAPGGGTGANSVPMPSREALPPIIVNVVVEIDGKEIPAHITIDDNALHQIRQQQQLRQMEYG